MSILLNEFQQPIGTPLPGWTARRPPERVTLTGRLCKVEPLDAARHALDLHTGYVLATNNQDWTYMTMGPFRSADDYRSYVESIVSSSDPMHFAVVDIRIGAAGSVTARHTASATSCACVTGVVLSCTAANTRCVKSA